MIDWPEGNGVIIKPYRRRGGGGSTSCGVSPKFAPIVPIHTGGRENGRWVPYAAAGHDKLPDIRQGTTSEVDGVEHA